MKTRKNYWIILFMLALTACGSSVAQTKLSTSDFYTHLQKDKNVQLIDVRTPEEYAEGHLQNAQNIDFHGADFVTQMNKLDKSKPVYVYCHSGNRSGQASNLMVQSGFKEVYDLKGGITDWEQSGLPVVK